MRQLKAFEYSSSMLLDAWSRLETMDPDRAVALAKKYPFHLSFDEMVAAIKEWQEATEKPPGILDWEPE